MKRSEKRDSLAGGLGILAAAAYLCIQGLKKVDAHIRKKTEKKP